MNHLFSEIPLTVVNTVRQAKSWARWRRAAKSTIYAFSSPVGFLKNVHKRANIHERRRGHLETGWLTNEAALCETQEAQGKRKRWIAVPRDLNN